MTWGGHANPNSANPNCAEVARASTPRFPYLACVIVGSGNLENLSGSVATGLRGRNFPAGAPHPICFWQAPAGAR
jgi:hypothetical protein